MAEWRQLARREPGASALPAEKLRAAFGHHGQVDAVLGHDLLDASSSTRETRSENPACACAQHLDYDRGETYAVATGAARAQDDPIALVHMSFEIAESHRLQASIGWAWPSRSAEPVDSTMSGQHLFAAAPSPVATTGVVQRAASGAAIGGPFTASSDAAIVERARVAVVASRRFGPLGRRNS